MDFIKKAKENIGKITGTGEEKQETLVNPFIKKQEQTVTTPSTPKLPGLPGMKSNLPGVPPKKPGLPPVGNLPSKPTTLPSMPKVQPAVEETKVEEIAKELENQSVDIPPVEDTNTDLNNNNIEVKETKSQVQDKETKGKRGRGKNKKNQEQNISEEVSSDENISSNIEETTPSRTINMSYTDALSLVNVSYADDEWNTFRTDIETRMNEIVITNDMTDVKIINALSQLSEIRDDIWTKLSDTKVLFDNLSAEKPEGLIERVKKLNVEGSNDLERKKRAVEAAEKYKIDGNVVNLYELLNETRSRYYFLKSVSDNITFKTTVLCSMLKKVNYTGGTMNV